MLWAALLSLFAVGCTRARSRGDPHLSSHTMTHAGLQRSYHLLVPGSARDGGPMPLVLALHGGGGDGERMCTLRGGVQELAERQRFLVACPDGLENHWNDGRGVEDYRAHAEGVDDVGFLLALIDQLGAELQLDPDRVFVTGVSNGGMMSLRLACEAADIFAGAAAVIASLPAELDCQPARPISLLLMNGTRDPLVPWEGGQVRFLRQELGQVLSTPETIAFWAAANGCDPHPRSQSLPDLDPQDGTRIQQDEYLGCAGAAQVVLYTVEGGGHTWPGGQQYAPRLLVGRVSQDLHAGEAIWNFFESLAR